MKKGRYGGTFAHKDIAFEFASAISPVFKLYLIKEFQRLKEEDNNREKVEWDAKRFLSKNNYLIQTDAIKNYIIPKGDFRINLEWLHMQMKQIFLTLFCLDLQRSHGERLIQIWQNAVM